MGFGSSLFCAFSSRPLLPVSVLDRVSSVLGYDRINIEGVNGTSVLFGLINLLILSTSLSIIAGLWGSVPLFVCLALPVASFAGLLAIPKVVLKGSGIRRILDSALCFDVFSTVLLGTGDVGLAARRASQGNGRDSERFRKAVMLMRSGTPAEKAVLQVFRGDASSPGWVWSAVQGREGDLTQVISEWHSELHSKILGVDDILSLLVAVSTILPIGVSMVMSVWRLVPTVLSPLMVVTLSLSLEAIFIWFRELEEAFH
ncbi:MAG: hypothetical protein QFX35_04105 [Candidatus Verstraetearchaeota archaeon]|nr:hypothetical protein [Candidatus Verstraetearchaeota archaeon]